MNVKLDTKEKFTVITTDESFLSANMTGELDELLLAFLKKDIPHIVFNMQQVENADDPVCHRLSDLQHAFYAENRSFVICHLSPTVEKRLLELDLLETMNITPSESEAWDIVQMEEIERDLLSGKWD